MSQRGRECAPDDSKACSPHERSDVRDEHRVPGITSPYADGPLTRASPVQYFATTSGAAPNR